MPTPLGLTLYNLAKRREPGAETARPQRPQGRLVWLHAPSETATGAMLALAHRLIDEDGVAVVLTCPTTLSPKDGLILQPPPRDTPPEARAFLDHWRPEAAVFSEGELRPALLHETFERTIPMFLVNGRLPAFLRERDGWYPGLMRSALSRFRHIAAVDEAAARTFRKAGAALSAVAVTGRMEEQSAALPCLEAERAALAKLLAARPVWFAAGVPESEEASILKAHRMAQQHSHRLLLILLPSDPVRTAALAQSWEADHGLAVAERSLEQEPDADIDVFMVDNPAEYGLWYRLSPITFLGGSLADNGPTRSPMEAAALGSAILHGPRTGEFGPIFGRLGAARATRAVASANDLGEALGDLLAPDRAARLAQAAWAVVSDGAEATDGVLKRLRSILDGPE
jgi:3-deoxy-D-manno-octulosonic-acid transferase